MFIQCATPCLNIVIVYINKVYSQISHAFDHSNKFHIFTQSTAVEAVHEISQSLKNLYDSADLTLDQMDSVADDLFEAVGNLNLVNT